jgi:hypothetical protein
MTRAYCDLIANRKWLRVFVVAILLLTLVLVNLTFQAPIRPHRDMRATLELMKVGMSRAEVISVLGDSPGDYAPGYFIYPDVNWKNFASDYDYWVYDDLMLTVVFDQHNNATKVKIFKGTCLTEPTLLDQLRGKIRLWSSETLRRSNR